MPFTTRDGRKFGLTVGVAFLALAALVRWRGGETASLVLGAVGGLLALAGMVIPGRLGPVYAAWMRLALLISKVTTPIFMGLIYFVALTPTALLRRLFGGNPLRHKAADKGFWAGRPEASADPASTMTRQF